jgi:hypothetical protein
VLTIYYLSAVPQLSAFAARKLRDAVEKPEKGDEENNNTFNVVDNDDELSRKRARIETQLAEQTSQVKYLESTSLLSEVFSGFSEADPIAMGSAQLTLRKHDKKQFLLSDPDMDTGSIAESEGEDKALDMARLVRHKILLFYIYSWAYISAHHKFSQCQILFVQIKTTNSRMDQ